MHSYTEGSVWRIKNPVLGNDYGLWTLRFEEDSDGDPIAVLVDEDGDYWDTVAIDDSITQLDWDLLLGKHMDYVAERIVRVAGNNYVLPGAVDTPTVEPQDLNGLPYRGEHPCRVLFDANPRHHCERCKRSLMGPKVEEPEDIVVDIEHYFEEPVARQGWDNFNNFSRGQMVHGYVHIATGTQITRQIGTKWCWSSGCFNPATGKHQVFIIADGQTMQEFMADLEDWMKENPWCARH